MKLLLLLLIIITIIIGIYLYNNYYNYSIQDDGNMEITKNIPENIPEEIPEEIQNNCSRTNKLINIYLRKNNNFDTKNILKSNIESELETNIGTEINIKTKHKLKSNSDYIDILIANSNLDIEIPTLDNPECIDSNNLTKHQYNKTKTETNTKSQSKTKKIIDWYLRANSENDETKYDNFKLIGDDIIDTDEDTSIDTKVYIDDNNNNIDEDEDEDEDEDDNDPNLIKK